VSDPGNVSHEYYVMPAQGPELACASGELIDSITSSLAEVGYALASKTEVQADVRTYLERILHDVKEVSSIMQGKKT
jgi:hypothetical protein